MSVFPISKKSELGYDREKVDAFLAVARSAYEGSQEGEAAAVTSAQIRAMSFPVQAKGYSARFVDAAMDRLEEVFFERERRAFIAEHGEDTWWDQTKQLLSDVRGRIKRPEGIRFRRRSVFATGYHRGQVDAFIDQIALALEGRIELSTADVRAVVFHPQLRGYDEEQVDAFLDAVIEILLSTQ